MKNTTTEQKSMKNIEVMKNITAMEKTAFASKTAMKKITAKITTTALLFFLAFFSLTTCLVAQESGQARKQGWFVGVSPYFLGAEDQNYHRKHHSYRKIHKVTRIWMLQLWHSLRAPPIKQRALTKLVVLFL